MARGHTCPALAALAAVVAVEVVHQAVAIPHGERRRRLESFGYNFSDPKWTPNAVNYTTIPDPGKSYGHWEGWGTSLCWWANVYGRRDDVADVLFTPGTVAVAGLSSPLPGLALNIARYNAGGSSSKPAFNQTMQVSPRIPSWKQIHGFWLDWASEDATSSSWDWSVDGNQVAMLLKAVSRGANLVTLFSNSPMWWMCANHNPSGSTLGVTDNLQTWNHQQHAVYLASVAAHAASAWNVHFDSVEPFNEPASDWWIADGTQEGCHFSPSTQASVLPLVRQELDHRGLASVSVAASDENTYTLGLSTWNSFDAATRANVGRVNVHGYEQGGGRRDLLREAVGSLRLWNSEYGDGDASGMSLATNLNLDFRWLHNTAWVYWQALDGVGWGLVQVDEDHGALQGVNPKYYVLAQYTRHIRPGMLIIDGGEANTVAAYDASTERLVLVTANYGAEQWVTYDLSKFPQVGGAVTRWCTNTKGGEMYVEHHDVSVAPGGKFTVRFAPYTVQTFEVGKASAAKDNVEFV